MRNSKLNTVRVILKKMEVWGECFDIRMEGQTKHLEGQAEHMADQEARAVLTTYFPEF